MWEYTYIVRLHEFMAVGSVEGLVVEAGCMMPPIMPPRIAAALLSFGESEVMLEELKAFELFVPLADALGTIGLLLAVVAVIPALDCDDGETSDVVRFTDEVSDIDVGPSVWTVALTAAVTAAKAFQ